MNPLTPCWIYYFWDGSESQAQLLDQGYGPQTACGDQISVFQASVTAEASYGLLVQSFTGSVVRNPHPAPRDHQAMAATKWRDRMVAIGAQGAGTVRFTFEFLAATSGGSFPPAVSLSAGGALLAGGVSQSDVYVHDYGMAFGSPFDFEVAMLKGALQGTLRLNAGPCDSREGAADFRLELVAVDVLDGSGAPLPHAIVIGTSGTVYSGSPPAAAVRVIPSDVPLTDRLGASWSEATSLWWALELAKLPGGLPEGIWLKADPRAPYLPVPLFGADRSASIVPTSDVTLYGGFAGWETYLDERDPGLHPTVLSGDLLGDDVPGQPAFNRGDNAYHVVRIPPGRTGVVLDGLTIRGGQADGTGADKRGGGVHFATTESTASAEARFLGCTFEDNHAAEGGGAVSVWMRGTADFESCRFIDNSAGTGGGAAMCHEHQARITAFVDCHFEENRAASCCGGGAVHSQQLTPLLVEGCTFIGNQAGSSGAIRKDSGQLVLRSTSFADNVAAGGPGAVGIYGAGLEVEDSTFLKNSALSGGGGAIFIQSTQPWAIRRSQFEQNFANGHGGAVGGYSSSGVIEECVLVDNTASIGDGGALFLDNKWSSATVVVRDCELARNSSVNGGGMLLRGSNARAIGCAFEQHSGTAAVRAGDGARIENSIFRGNGRGIYQIGQGFTVHQCLFIGNNRAVLPWRGSLESPVLVTNSTFVGNGWAFASYSNGFPWAASIASCILVGNGQAPFDAHLLQPVANVLVEHSNVEGGWSGPGTGNVDADPLFLALPHPGPDGLWGTEDDWPGDLRLHRGSPCVDAGLDSAVPPDVFDVDGDGDVTEPVPLDFAGRPRFVGAQVDMGAYERQPFELVSPQAF